MQNGYNKKNRQIPMLLVLALCKALNAKHTSSILAAVATVVTGLCERKRD